jgi:hypothetical protein
LGNVEQTHRDTLNKLSGLRDRARYLKGDISMSDDMANDFLGIVKDMLEFTNGYVGFNK